MKVSEIKGFRVRALESFGPALKCLKGYGWTVPQVFFFFLIYNGNNISIY